MRLADFIEIHRPAILAEWETFAMTRLPSAATMDTPALRDHAPQILEAIAIDLRQFQTDAEQFSKSQGLAAITRTAAQSAAAAHGRLRARDGFSMTQLVSEFRALRASVLRLWMESNGTFGETTVVVDIVRFNEAVDQAIAESVCFFNHEFFEERNAHHMAVQALARNRSRLEYVSRLSHLGFWYCNLPFDVLEWDEQVKQHFFYEPEAIVTIDDFYARIHPDDREMTRSSIDASINSRTTYDIIYRTVHPTTGQLKWIRALGGTDYASDGSPIHFDGITVDVTAQKFEQQRVVESEARYRGVCENMEEAFTLFDNAFNIIEANDAACSLVGIARTALVGSNHWKQFPGTYESDLGQMYRKVLSDGQPQLLEHHYVYADGRQAWYEVRAFKVEENVAVLFRDVTQRREMIEALQEADKRKDEFLAMLAHELRNPLAPITTAGEILARMPNLNAPAAAATAVIRRQAKHMARLIDDLLDVARVTQGRIQLHKSAVDISDVILQAVETCEPQLKSKEHRLTVSIEKTTPLFVFGDAARLVQCVGNILSNAGKYTDPHGYIEVNVRRDQNFVLIEIVDSGSGITQNLLPKVFDLFVQSHRTLDRSQGGLGVGLAIVKRLIEMHDGQVQAFSKGEKQGSTFKIRLPCIEVSTLTSKEIAESIKPFSRRVLVVDDNVDAAATVVMLLEMQGHVPMAVHSADEALTQINTFKPDVMLIDIGLPDMDGYELVRQLRKSPSTQALRKIALTGYGQPADKQRALANGFDEHLVKPVEIDALERAIARLA